MSEAAQVAEQPEEAVQEAAQVPATTQEAGVPATVDQYIQDFGDAGFEFGSSRDYVVPRLSILQSNSPQVAIGGPDHIEGAQAGNFFIKGSQNPVVNAKEGLLFIPTMYKPQYLVWKPKEQGGGLVGVYEEHEAMKMKTVRQGSKDVLPDGNHLQRHSNIFGFLVDVNKKEWSPFVMSLASTQQKYASLLYTQLKNQTRAVTVNGRTQKVPLPIFLNVCKMTTKPESNQHGTWFSFQFDRVGDLLGSGNEKNFFDFAPELAEEASRFYQDIKSGMAQVEVEEFDPETGEMPF
jgi:hypothetical protein